MAHDEPTPPPQGGVEEGKARADHAQGPNNLIAPKA